MNILEFGDRIKRKIILIHGFQSPWQIWEKYIEHYKNDFHIIVPIITGHDVEKKEDFISFVTDAEQIEDYVLSRYGESVYSVFSMSMGGVLAATLWQNKRLKFEKVIFDGSPLVSINRLVSKYMLNFYLKVTHKTQQRDKKTLEQAIAICPSAQQENFLQLMDNMSDITIRNSLASIASFKLKCDIDTPNTTPYFFYGTAMNEMLAKKSAKYLKKYYPNTVVKCFAGKAHCENSLHYPELMINELDKIFYK